MRKWTDERGDTWLLHLNIARARAMRDLYGLNIFDLSDPELVEDFYERLADLETVVNVLWLLCREQLAERRVDEEGFAERLHGDSFNDAIDALNGAITDFFPKASASLLARVQDAINRKTNTSTFGASLINHSDTSD